MHYLQSLGEGCPRAHPKNQKMLDPSKSQRRASQLLTSFLLGLNVIARLRKRRREVAGCAGSLAGTEGRQAAASGICRGRDTSYLSIRAWKHQGRYSA